MSDETRRGLATGLMFGYFHAEDLEIADSCVKH